MSGFVHDLLSFAFLRNAAIAAFLAAICCGIVGSFTVVRRSTYLAGAISHCVLGGIGGALLLQSLLGWRWSTPLAGATVAAVAAALIVGTITLRARQRTDTALSAIWVLGMALGVTFIALTPGYSRDLMSYLFGNILMVSSADLWLMAALDAVVVVLTVLFYNKFLAISFNEEIARIRGLRVGFYTQMLLVMTALTVVVLVQVVGVVLVIAMLALPAAAASLITSRLSSTIVLAMALTAVLTLSGIAVSYGLELPAGATIVETSAVVYGLVLVYRRIRPKAGG